MISFRAYLACVRICCTSLWTVVLSLIVSAAPATAAQQVTLMWDPSPDASVVGYTVYCTDIAASSVVHIAVGNTNTCTVTNLIEGKTYSFFVTAHDAIGLESDPSNTIEYTVPSVPTLEVVTISLSNGMVGSPYSTQLTATGGQGTYSWSLAAGSGPLPPGLNLATSGLLSGTPTAGGTFNFVVRVADAAAHTATKNLNLTIVVVDTTPPSVPGGLTATSAGSTEVNLLWNPSTDSVGVAGYWVERSQGTGSAAFSQVATVATPSYHDGGLTAGTVYNYRVRAVDGAGNISGYSAVATATTGPALAVVTASLPDGTVGRPYSSQLAATGGQGAYSWSLAAGSGPIPSGLTLTTSGLLSGTPTTAGTFGFIAEVTDSASRTATRSLSLTVIVVDTTAPSVPAGLTTTLAGGTQVNLLWNASTDDVGVVGYRVERSQGTGSAAFSQVATVPATAYSDIGLAAGTVYNYRVRAVDEAGNASGYSTAATVTTPGFSPAAGLVAAFGFNEETGVTVMDSSGHGNDGTIEGATRTAQGRFRGALSFDGSSLVTVADSDSLDLSDGMTVEAWLHPTASPNSWSTVLMKEQSGGLSYTLYAGSPANQPNVYVYTVGEQGVAGPTSLPRNTWSHLAGTYDGTTLRLYVNGNEVAIREISGSIVGASGPLRIGGNGVWGEYFRGLIDEVRVYNRALTQTEIQADMETAIGANPEVSLAVFPQTADQIARDGFRLRLLATAPAGYTIEYTTNLATWQTLQTIQATNGPVEIVDPNADSSSVRLYRVRQP